MKKLTMILAVVGLLSLENAASASVVGWNAWGVHGVTTSDNGSGDISFQDGGTAYHWEDSYTGHIRTGGKSFYSTAYLNGQKVSAIDTLTWTNVDDPDQGTPYVNVLIEYTTGGNTYTAILAPNDDRKNGDWGDDPGELMAGHTANDWDFYIYEGSDFSGDNESSVFDFYDGGNVGPAGRDGTDSWCTYALYEDVKDMIIIGGGQQLCPATATGGPGTADYSDRAANWDYWGNGAELDGLSFVWGARQLKDPFDGNAPIIGTISLNGMDSSTIPEPASIIVWGLLGAGCAGGALAARRRRRRAPWSEETRQNIHQIIDRGRINA